MRRTDSPETMRHRCLVNETIAINVSRYCLLKFHLLQTWQNTWTRGLRLCAVSCRSYFYNLLQTILLWIKVTLIYLFASIPYIYIWVTAYRSLIAESSLFSIILILSQLSRIQSNRSRMNLKSNGTKIRLWITPRVITINIILKKITNEVAGAYSIPTTPNKVEIAPWRTGFHTESSVLSTISSSDSLLFFLSM